MGIPCIILRVPHTPTPMRKIAFPHDSRHLHRLAGIFIFAAIINTKRNMEQSVPFSQWFGRHKMTLLRWSLALVYLWFGALKFVQGLSPADALAKDTIRMLTFGVIPDHISIVLLAVWEVGIGLIFFSGRFVPFGVKAAVVHIVLTFTPLFFFPDLSFTHVPYGFTLVGQYSVKNVVFLVALGMLWEEARTGRRV